MTALKLAQSDQAKSEKNLKKDKRGLTTQLKEEELAHETYIKNLKKVYKNCSYSMKLFFAYMNKVFFNLVGFFFHLSVNFYLKKVCSN